MSNKGTTSGFPQFQPPKLGVGFTYSSALDPILEEFGDRIDVVEIEPQSFWLAETPVEGPFVVQKTIEEKVLSIDKNKLVHSVAIPLAGHRKPSPEQCALLKKFCTQVNSPWISEHLSVGGTPHQHAGFLLPPRQTDAGVVLAADNVVEFRNRVNRPVAIELGVSYLANRSDEMQDGIFVDSVLRTADCGLLLDLHNLYCNERNGRGSMEGFIERIQPERVWEVHLAGGMLRDGFWLDAHSGPMPVDLKGRACEIIRALPNIGAIIFEIYPTFLRDLPSREIGNILDDLNMLWDEAKRGSTKTKKYDTPIVSKLVSQEPDRNNITPKMWEDNLCGLLTGSNTDPAGSIENGNKEAIELYRDLIGSFRGSMLVRILPRTIKYLMLHLGSKFESTIQRYYSTSPPQMFGLCEANSFQEFLARDQANDDITRALSEYDLALIMVPLDNVSRTVKFPGNPIPLLSALSQDTLLDEPLQPPVWEIEITPDPKTDEQIGDLQTFTS